MIVKLSAAALILVLAVPVLAETKATISPAPADPCAVVAEGAAKPADCPAAAAATPGKLGSAIKPLKGSDHDSEGETESEDGDED